MRFPLDFKITKPLVCECTQTEQTLNTVRVRRAHALIRSRSAPKGTTAAAYIVAATEGRRVTTSLGRSGYARFHSGHAMCATVVTSGTTSGDLGLYLSLGSPLSLSLTA